MFETVLLTLDQSKESKQTSKQALQLALSHGSRLIVLSVLQPQEPLMNDQESVETLLAQARELAEKAGINCQILERKGNPPFVICDVADELDVDVIVMGTRGINLSGDSLSTAARVIELAPCPVLVVP